MKMKIKKYIFTGLFSVLVTVLAAQYPSQQMLFDNVPQSRKYDVGFFPEYSGHFGMPGLSNVGYSLNNSGFVINDLFQTSAGLIGGQVDTDIYSFDEIMSFYNSLRDDNYLNSGLGLDLVNFGFKVKKNYFSLNATLRQDLQLTYGKGLFDLLVNGNADYIGESISFDGFSAEVTAYTELGVGYTRLVNDNLSVGGKLKVLLGLGNLKGEAGGSLYTDPDDYSLTLAAIIQVIFMVGVFCLPRTVELKCHMLILQILD